MTPSFGSDDAENDVVIADESNSVRSGRRPARESIRKAVRNRLEKDRKLLELMEKMKENPQQGRNGTAADAEVTPNA